MPDLVKPEWSKLVQLFLEKMDTRKMLWTSGSLRITGMTPSSAVLDRSRKISFVTENVAHEDAVKAGVGTDPDRRAYHLAWLHR